MVHDLDVDNPAGLDKLAGDPQVLCARCGVPGGVLCGVLDYAEFSTYYVATWLLLAENASQLTRNNSA
jgi:hypothetical protein